jgi:hypothetical protein
MKIHAAAVEDVPSAVSAAPTVLYSPDVVPLPRTVRQPLGVLSRAVLFSSIAGAAMEEASRDKRTTAWLRKWDVENIMSSFD